ncbi:WhiB family transcriptional regulator [Phycicoccus sp. MAQZ13P-2]|nr:WhiB family transcriptional regulator [Phycicoccus mangrovi]MBT9256292.1 WhiB family transcriptional regulator [Phycicoccus mangrovi]MBT9273712.1 WhiB family transcriptional regulator [Phycicoccus mangrovi]
MGEPHRPGRGDSTASESAQSRGEFPCRGTDADLWFAEHQEDIDRAKALCRACGARDSCLRGARERGEPHGVWGGELFVRGVVLTRKPQRGRPRRRPVVGDDLDPPEVPGSSPRGRSGSSSGA